jgi:hypothetical protein
MVMRREFIVGLFTDRYLASVPIFAINLTLIPLGMLMVDPIMRAYAEHRLFLVKLHGILLVLLTAALALTIGRFGLIGAITLMVTFTYIGRFATAIKVIRILRVTARDAVLLIDVAKIAGATVAAAAMASLARTLTLHMPPLAALAICGAAFASVYAAAIVGFGIATPEERAIVVNRIFGALRSPRPLAQAATFARE